MSRTMNRIIALYGEDVTIKPREETSDQYGKPLFSYPSSIWFTTRMTFYQPIGDAEDFNRMGYDRNVEEVAIIYHTMKGSMNPMDLVEKADGSVFEILRIVERSRGNLLDFIELSLRRVER